MNFAKKALHSLLLVSLGSLAHAADETGPLRAFCTGEGYRIAVYLNESHSERATVVFSEDSSFTTPVERWYPSRISTDGPAFTELYRSGRQGGLRLSIGKKKATSAGLRAEAKLWTDLLGRSISMQCNLYVPRD